MRLGFGFVLRKPTVAMMKPDMQKAHWKPCSSTTPCCTGCNLPSAAASPSIVTIFRPRIVDENRACAALGAVAADLGPGESELVAERRRQRFLFEHVDAPILAVDVQRDQPLDASGRRRLLTRQRRRAPQIARRGHRRS